MKIKNEIKIAAPLDTVWATLDDIPRVARCAPGAELLEQKEDGTCVGRVGVKLGPVALQFKGTVQFTERDEATHRVVAKAKGAEEKARGTASADVVFQLYEDSGGTKIVVESDVQLAGFIAQYGRGAALIQSTAQAIMNQFAKNLEADLTGGEAAPTGDISLAKVVAQGLWTAGKEAFRKKSSTD
jgi:carbon monoxide dehydrogenase subunit G